MRFHTLRTTQWVPCKIEQVFDFFSDARNLERLTPPWLNFRILTPDPIVVQKGTHIRYRLGWHGLPMYWTTEIRSWQPMARFSDAQISGPYSLWHHTHSFIAEGNGTRMNDVVRFRLPFGPFGRVAYKLKVRADVEKIFAYRHQAVEELFGRE